MENRITGTANAVEQLSAGAKTAMDAVKELREALADVGERVSPYINRDKARRAAQVSGDYVRNHRTSVLAATVAIAALGVWLSTRRWD